MMPTPLLAADVEHLRLDPAVEQRVRRLMDQQREAERAGDLGPPRRCARRCRTRCRRRAPCPGGRGVERADRLLERNQKSAAGVMKRPKAGFNSSGIFGIVGVDTKLKYQSILDPHHTADDVRPAKQKGDERLGIDRPAGVLAVNEEHHERQHEAGDNHVAKISQKAAMANLPL